MSWFKWFSQLFHLGSSSPRNDPRPVMHVPLCDTAPCDMLGALPPELLERVIRYAVDGRDTETAERLSLVNKYMFSRVKLVARACPDLVAGLYSLPPELRVDVQSAAPWYENVGDPDYCGEIIREERELPAGKNMRTMFLPLTRSRRQRHDVVYCGITAGFTSLTLMIGGATVVTCGAPLLEVLSSKLLILTSLVPCMQSVDYNDWELCYSSSVPLRLRTEKRVRREGSRAPNGFRKFVEVVTIGDWRRPSIWQGGATHIRVSGIVRGEGLLIACKDGRGVQRVDLLDRVILSISEVGSYSFSGRALASSPCLASAPVGVQQCYYLRLDERLPCTRVQIELELRLRAGVSAPAVAVWCFGLNLLDSRAGFMGIAYRL